VAGAQDPDRHREEILEVAVCHKCGQESEGWTTFESMTWSPKPVGRAIHFCFGCEAGIVERPLDAVLADLLATD
jgi:hypothetical protein